MSAAASLRVDGWYNLVSGLGSDAIDRIVSHVFARGSTLSVEQCLALYHGDDLAARICDELPLSCMRQPLQVSVDDDPDGEKASDILNELRRLGAQERIAEAAIWARVTGGGALLLGVDDGRKASEPLEPKRLRRVLYLEALDRGMLTASTWYDDKADDVAKIGTPSIYRLYRATSGGRARETVDVHESRLIFFPGALTSPMERARNSGWDHSVLQRVYPILQQANHNWQSVSRLLANSAQTVMAIQNLRELISAGKKAVLQERLELTEQARQMGILPIDAEKERFEYHSSSLGGVTDITDQTWKRLAAAAHMPVTVLMGVSPAGLNATGESDIRLWYDVVRSTQIHDLKPRIERLLDLLWLAKEGPGQGKIPEHYELEFGPLWQMSPEQSAALRDQVSQTDERYFSIGALTPEQIRQSRWRAEGWSMETTIEDAAAGELEAADDAAFLERLAGKRKDPALPAPAIDVEGQPVVEPAVSPEAKDPTQALNGAQVTGLLAIVVAVAEGQIPRESGVAMIAASFPLSPEEAEAIMGTTGTPEFEPKKPPVPQPFGNPPPPVDSPDEKTKPDPVQPPPKEDDEKEAS